jgi:pimeloyl-ACP methyl ester carboxylesterase
LDRLSEDVIAVADAVGFDRFHLVGHDWGAAVGWASAHCCRHRVISLSVLSTPHPAAYAEALGVVDDQLRRSAYVLFLRIPWLNEFILGFNRAALLKHFYWLSVTSGQLAEYLKVFSEPGAISAALKWYMASTAETLAGAGKSSLPTLFIWGNRDEALGRTAAEKSVDYVTGPYRLVKLQAGHALVYEMLGRVASELLTHFKRWRAGAEKIAPVPRTLLRFGAGAMFKLVWWRGCRLSL